MWSRRDICSFLFYFLFVNEEREAFTINLRISSSNHVMDQVGKPFDNVEFSFDFFHHRTNKASHRLTFHPPWKISFLSSKSQSLHPTNVVWLGTTIISIVCVFFNFETINKSNKFCLPVLLAFLNLWHYLQHNSALKSVGGKRRKDLRPKGNLKKIRESKQFSGSTRFNGYVMAFVAMWGKSVISEDRIYKDIFLSSSVHPLHSLMMSQRKAFTKLSKVKLKFPPAWILPRRQKRQNFQKEFTEKKLMILQLKRAFLVAWFFVMNRRQKVPLFHSRIVFGYICLLSLMLFKRIYARNTS